MAKELAICEDFDRLGAGYIGTASGFNRGCHFFAWDQYTAFLNYGSPLAPGKSRACRMQYGGGGYFPDDTKVEIVSGFYVWANSSGSGVRIYDSAGRYYKVNFYTTEEKLRLLRSDNTVVFESAAGVLPNTGYSYVEFLIKLDGAGGGRISGSHL